MKKFGVIFGKCDIKLKKKSETEQILFHSNLSGWKTAA